MFCYVCRIAGNDVYLEVVLKMTPVEAIELTMASARDKDWEDTAKAFFVRLRNLGFTVVPIQPTDEQVEAIRKVWCQWHTHPESARAAYAAVVWEIS